MNIQAAGYVCMAVEASRIMAGENNSIEQVEVQDLTIPKAVTFDGPDDVGVETSITLTSKDGFKQSYVVSTDTRVRIDGKKSTISAVKDGDTAGVIAKVSGSTQTAVAVVERAAKAGSTT